MLFRAIPNDNALKVRGGGSGSSKGSQEPVEALLGGQSSHRHGHCLTGLGEGRQWLGLSRIKIFKVDDVGNYVHIIRKDMKRFGVAFGGV